MRKVRQIIGKTTVILLWAVFCLAVFEAGIIIFNFTPVKWYTRFNCLCGRAHFHAGEHFSPDDMLFNEIGRQEFSDEQIQIFSQHCRRHDEGIIITIYYTSQRILKEKHGVKKIDIPGWKKEQAVLHQKEEERTAQYKPLREKLNQMLNVKYCVETARHGENDKRRNKNKTQPQL